MTDPRTSPHRVDLLALAERIEKASGPDRELDAEVWCALFAPAGAVVEQSKLNGAWCIYDGMEQRHPDQRRLWTGKNSRVVPVTESNDDAMKLLPDGAGFMLNRYWIAKSEDPVWSAHITTGGVPDNPSQSFEAMDAPSAALATTAAALKAKARTGGSSHGR